KQLLGVPFAESVVASEIGSYKPALGHWREFTARTGADPARHVHVGASLFHDIAPTRRLGLPTVWINRLAERPAPEPDAELPVPGPARARTAWLADAGSFSEEADDLRSADPLDFFDMRPYVERLTEAELNTGLGEAIVVGAGTLDGYPLEFAVMDLSFLGGSME